MSQSLQAVLQIYVKSLLHKYRILYILYLILVSSLCIIRGGVLVGLAGGQQLPVTACYVSRLVCAGLDGLLVRVTGFEGCFFISLVFGVWDSSGVCCLDGIPLPLSCCYSAFLGNYRCSGAWLRVVPLGVAGFQVPQIYGIFGQSLVGVPHIYGTFVTFPLSPLVFVCLTQAGLTKFCSLKK